MQSKFLKYLWLKSPKEFSELHIKNAVLYSEINCRSLRVEGKKKRAFSNILYTACCTVK